MMEGIAPAAQDVQNPFDATPDPDGNQIFFTAADPTLGTGVYKVPAAGGASSPVTVGDPFVAPFGIAITGDGMTLFVADPAADSLIMDPASEAVGQLFTLSVAGGAVTPLAGTAGLKPRGIELGPDNVIYFTGHTLVGVPAVFKVPKAGDTPIVVASGAPMFDPGGIAIATNGDIYFSDGVSIETGKSSIFKIANGSGTATEIVAGLKVGYPIGISLNMANTTLLVSGLNPDTLTDAVIQIDLATLQQTLYVGDADTDITIFENPAGLHRAKNKDIFAWADSKAKPNPAQPAAGTVFTITF